MNNLLSYTNNLAICLSALCVAHCLASPILIVLLPSLTVLGLENEAFHTWLLMGVIPSSLISLLLGCKQHNFYRVILIGVCGLAFLLSALLVEDLAYGEVLEKVLTVVGAVIMSYGHYLNFRYCRQSSKNDKCDCQSA